MNEKVNERITCLLSPTKDINGERKRAAEELAKELLNVNAFNALYSVCAYPDVFALEDHLLQTAGASAGIILSTRDQAEDPKVYHKLDPKYFDGFHPEALSAALGVLTEEQKERLYEYTIETPECSEALSSVFYLWAVERSLKYVGKDPARAMRASANAITLFTRVMKDVKKIRPHFDNIAMHVVCGEPNVAIVSLFFHLFKVMPKMNFPETDFEIYESFHIKILTAFASSHFAHIQKLYASLKQVIQEKYREDQEMLATLDLILKGDFREAYRSCERLKGHEKTKHQELGDPSFYQAWYLIVNWLIKERVF